MKILHIVSWYDRSIKLYTAVLHDRKSNQIGDAGYGPTNGSARLDVKDQLPIEGYELRPEDKPEVRNVP